MTWAPDYVTVRQLASYLRIEDQADDVFLQTWVTTVSRNIDNHCGRQFGKSTAVTRYYQPFYDRHLGHWYAEIDDLQDLTGLAVVDEDGNTVTDYTLLPRNQAANGKPFTQIQLAGRTGELGILAPWGWTAVPSGVTTGMFLQGARLAARRDSPFGVAGSPTEGSEMRLLAQLDPDFRVALNPLRRERWVA